MTAVGMPVVMFPKEEFIVYSDSQAKRTSPNNGRKQISRSTNSSFSKATPKALVVGKEHKAKSSLLFTTSQKFQKSPGHGLATYRDMDVARSVNKIPMPKSPVKSGTVQDGFHDESPEKLDPMEQGSEDIAAPEVVAEKPIGALLSPGSTMSTGLAVNGNGISRFMALLMTNCTSPLQTSVMSVKAGKKKFIKDRRDQPFAKRLRFSVRQRESAYRYRDIVIWKQDGFTLILVSTMSSKSNLLNPEGQDFLYFIRRLPDDRKRESSRMAEANRNFVNTFIQFKKPIDVAVNGRPFG
ncbi:unnamed protein product [Rangifer tarandus platyrhynchus]|uniref:Uncharacterized protein n=1 Tax=Rangifer tarandus platyrhynchus TaxID=3082113 RepID=A0ABN9A706_RANTA|nr:unnamed protein product [Rangifer tarandus platyrhynchus]